MAADAAELYIVIAPIAAAFAGFGGLASGIHQRRGRDDARVDAFRLATMLFSSLSATLLGLLPATLEGLLLGDRAAVRVCAFVALVGIAVYVPIGVRRARKNPECNRVQQERRSGQQRLPADGICLLQPVRRRRVGRWRAGALPARPGGIAQLVRRHVLACYRLDAASRPRPLKLETAIPNHAMPGAIRAW